MISYLDKIGLEYFWGKIKSKLSTKVDKVDGKGLSTNDYTTVEKNKLAGIAEGAEVNVQSDWNATSGDAVILNKPNIPSATSISQSPGTGTSITLGTTSYPITANDEPTGSSQGMYAPTWSAMNRALEAKQNTLISGNNIKTINNQSLLGSENITIKENVQSDWNATSGDATILNKPTIPTNYAGSPETGGTANKTASIPYAQVDSTSTATVFTATVDGITELRDGVCCLLKNGIVTSASGFTLDVNNLGAKPCYTNLAAATRDTTIFNVNYTMLFVYDSTRVDGGGWICYRGYDSNTNTLGYQIRTNYSTLAMSDRMYRYRLYFTSADGQSWVPSTTSTATNATSKRDVNQRPIDPFGPIGCYGSTGSFAADETGPETTGFQQYAFTLGHAFNTTGAALTLNLNKPVYVKCTPQTDGSAIIDADEPYTQSLPTSENGFIYIFLGIAYDATHIELRLEHPVYYYKDGAIRLWTNGTSDELEKKVNDNSLITSAALTDLNDRINNIPIVPTKTSELTNDSRYITDKDKIYFSFSALENGTFGFTHSVEGNVLYYSKNYETWAELTEPISVVTGDVVRFKGELTANLTKGIGTFTSDGTFDVFGNIMSLIYSDDFVDKYAIKENYQFRRLLMSTKVVSAENLLLPATTLTLGCYGYMFQSCAELLIAPELPAQNLVNSAYMLMFGGCTKLEKAPFLPAFVSNGAYKSMFYGCTMLNYVKVHAGDLCTVEQNVASFKNVNWLKDVATSGTIVLKGGQGYPIVRNPSFIPEGWKIMTDETDITTFATKDELATKQAILVSGTNIKTINNESLLGSGNLSTLIPVVNHGTLDTTYSLTPNVFHVWGQVTSLTLTLAAASDNTVVNEYMFIFESGSTPTVFSLTGSGLKWDSNIDTSTWTTEANTTYEFHIANNIVRVGGAV